MLKDSATVGHGVLIENVNGGCTEGDIIGVYGVHGVVIKSENMSCDTLRGYMNSVDNVIFKSDNFAPGGNIQVNSVVCERRLPNCTPYSTPATSQSGIYLNPELQNFTGPIQISKVRIRDAQYGILGGSATGNIGADVQFGVVDIDGIEGNTDYAIFIANLGKFPRMSFGDVNIKNVKNSIYINYTDSASAGSAQTTFNSIKITICASVVMVVAGYAKVSVGSIDVFGALTAYFIDNNAVLKIGTESLVGVTNKWGQNPPIIGTGWSNVAGGNSTFNIVLSGYEVKLRGLVQAGSGVTSLMLTLPAYLRPTENMRFIAYKKEGTNGSCLIGVASSGLVTINDGTAPAVGSYVSLDGISWKLKGEVM